MGWPLLYYVHQQVFWTYLLFLNHISKDQPNKREVPDGYSGFTKQEINSTTKEGKTYLTVKEYNADANFSKGTAFLLLQGLISNVSCNNREKSQYPFDIHIIILEFLK